MSKSITIPTNRGSRIVVTINGTTYTYQAGATETVPDEVAAIIEDYTRDPVSTRETAGDQLNTIVGSILELDTSVTALDARVTALEEAAEGEDSEDDTEAGGGS